jgi:hypothetical protein
MDDGSKAEDADAPERLEDVETVVVVCNRSGVENGEQILKNKGSQGRADRYDPRRSNICREFGAVSFSAELQGTCVTRTHEPASGRGACVDSLR